MKPITLLLALFAFAVYGSSCKKTANKTTNTPDIYIVGRMSDTTSGWSAFCWTNGNLTKLSYPDVGIANSVIVSGNTIYVGGELNTKPVIWKNTVPNYLSNKKGEVNEIKIVNGDVYATGNIIDSTTQIPVYWKNGVMTQLSPIVGDAHSIFISGNDVYVGGSLSDSNSIYYLNPTIWKNGNIIYHKPIFGDINAVCVSGNDVFAVGNFQEDSTTKNLFVKNNIETILSNYGGSLVDVFVNNSDVYISGMEWNDINRSNHNATVWKNNTVVPFAGNVNYSTVFSSTLFNNNIYSVGFNAMTEKPILWINGIDSVLFNSYGIPTSIFVQ